MAPGRRSATNTSPRLLAPLRDFLRTEAAGGALLVLATVVALLWANAPSSSWSSSYDELWQHRLAISLGDHALDLDLRHWINDGLMTVFFLVVGLEITRELAAGHLSTRRSAMLPVVAALGGMAVPAAIYLAIAGSTEPRGWAVPIATDIALAVGLVALAGRRLPPGSRPFLLGLAIVDDIGAIVVIAVAYSSGLSWRWLALAAAVILLTVGARRAGAPWTVLYVAFGLVLWLALHEAGLHATLAGVAMGLLAPTTARLSPAMIDIEDLADLGGIEAVHGTTELARDTLSVVEWLEHVLHPWTSFGVVPLFALANAGVTIDADQVADAATSPIVWGIIGGLVVGKPLGVVVASRLASRAGLAQPVDGLDGRQRWGLGAAAGIGFTVALFIAELAFDDEATVEQAKLAILVASIAAAAVSAVLLRRQRLADS